MSPKRSSTSSGNRFRRPRYLALEVSGSTALSPRALESLLHDRIASAGGGPLPFRVMKSEGARSLVEVAHTSVPRARQAWNATQALPDGRSLRLATRRTYGTMLKGKLWLRSSSERTKSGVERAAPRG